MIKVITKEEYFELIKDESWLDTTRFAKDMRLIENGLAGKLDEVYYFLEQKIDKEWLEAKLKSIQ